MEEPDTRLYHVEPFEDALGEGFRVLRSANHVYEVREHDDATSMVYWTSDTPSPGADGGYYAKVRTDAADDEEAYVHFRRYTDRLEEGYGVDLGIDPRTFHAERDDDPVVERSTDAFLVRYTQKNQLEPEQFGSVLDRLFDGRRLALLERWTLMDAEETFDRLNRRNALETVIPEMDHYDAGLNAELDRLGEATIEPPWKALQRYQFYDHHKLPGVFARHHTETYDGAMDAVQTMLDVDVGVDRPSIYTNPDAFTMFLDHLSYTDINGERRLTADGETLLRNALDHDDRPDAIDAYLDEHFAAAIGRIKDEAWLDDA